MQVFLAAPIARLQGQVADDQARRHGPRGLFVHRVTPGVADVRKGERNQLTRVGWIGEDFLVARHGGVEHHLPGRLSFSPDAPAMKDRAVFQCQYRLLRQSASSRYAKRESPNGFSRLDANQFRPRCGAQPRCRVRIMF